MSAPLVLRGRAVLSGLFLLERFRLGETKPYLVQGAYNAVTKSLFLDLGLGVSADHVTSASDLRIKNSGGTVQTTLGTMAAGYPSHSVEAQVVMKWEDNTTATYTAHTLEIVTPGGAVFSTAAPNFGVKPTTENWHYTYTLTFGAGTSALTPEGRDRWLRLVTGNASVHFDASSLFKVAGGGSDFDNGTKLTPTAGIAAQSAARLDADTAEWVFVAGDGQFEGSWTWFVIEDPPGAVRLRDGAFVPAASSKGVRIQRTFKYQLSV